MSEPSENKDNTDSGLPSIGAPLVWCENATVNSTNDAQM